MATSAETFVMYRVVLILSAALSLAACTSGGMGLDAVRPTRVMNTVRFESTPPGAKVKISDNRSCRTPCALILPVNAPAIVAFSLAGHQLVTKTLEPKVGSTRVQLAPNPVIANLIAEPMLKKKKMR